MEKEKKLIRDWLKRTNRTQAWLADQCGVTRAAVAYWLNPKKDNKIYRPVMKLIQRMMEDDKKQSPAKEIR